MPTDSNLDLAQIGDFLECAKQAKLCRTLPLIHQYGQPLDHNLQPNDMAAFLSLWSPSRLKLLYHHFLEFKKKTLVGSSSMKSTATRTQEPAQGGNRSFDLSSIFSLWRGASQDTRRGGVPSDIPTPLHLGTQFGACWLMHRQVSYKPNSFGFATEWNQKPHLKEPSHFNAAGYDLMVSHLSSMWASLNAAAAPEPRMGHKDSPLVQTQTILVRFIQILDLTCFFFGDAITLRLLGGFLSSNLGFVEHPAVRDQALNKPLETSGFYTAADSGHSTIQPPSTISFKDPASLMGVPPLIKTLQDLPLNSSRCGQFWEGEHTAYRCITCALSNSSCICPRCFHTSDHRGHDFALYRSELGGCCDCGDASAWRENGFCSRHLPTSKVVAAFNALKEDTKKFLSGVDSMERRRQEAYTHVWTILTCGMPAESNEFDAYDPSEILNPNLRNKFLFVFTILTRRCIGLLLNSLLAQPMSHQNPGESTDEPRTCAKEVTEGLLTHLSEWCNVHQAIRRVMDYSMELTPSWNCRWIDHFNVMRCFPDVKAKRNLELLAKRGTNQPQSALNPSSWIHLGTDMHRYEIPLVNALQQQTQTGPVETMDSDIMILPEDLDGEDDDMGFDSTPIVIGRAVDRPSPPHEDAPDLTELQMLTRNISAGGGIGRGVRGELCPMQMLLFLLPRLDRDELKIVTSMGRQATKITGCHSWVTNFFLELLFDRRFKLKFAREFMHHYAHLMTCFDPCVERITVQLFSIGGVLDDLFEKKLLMTRLFNCGTHLLSQCVIPNCLPPRLKLLPPTYHRKKILHSLCDMRLALVDAPTILAKVFAADDELSDRYLRNGWLRIMSLLQGSTQYRRRSGTHVEYEDTIQWSNACVLTSEVANIMDILLTYFREHAAEDSIQSKLPLMLETTSTALLKWLEQLIAKELPMSMNATDSLVRTIGFRERGQHWGIETADLTLQTPLSRFLYQTMAVFFRKGVSAGDLIWPLCCHDDTFSLNMFLALFELPIRAITLYHSVVTSHLWNRNGMATFNEAMLYRRHHWASAYMEADLLGLQLAFWAAADIAHKLESDPSVKNSVLMSVIKESADGAVFAQTHGLPQIQNTSPLDKWVLSKGLEIESGFLVTALVSELCDKFGLYSSLAIVEASGADVTQLNLDTSLFALLYTLGYLISLQGTPALASFAVPRSGTANQLQRVNMELLLLHRFLLPGVTGNKMPPVSDMLDISNNPNGRSTVLSILKNWVEEDLVNTSPSTHDPPPPALSRTFSDSGAGSPQHLTSVGASSFAQDVTEISKHKLGTEGWLRFNPFFPYIGWEEYQSLEDGFSKYIEDPKKLEEWWLTGCRWPLTDDFFLSTEEKRLVTANGECYFKLAKHPAFKAVALISLIQTLVCGLGKTQLSHMLVNKFVDRKEQTQKPGSIRLNVSERLLIVCLQFFTKLLAIERSWEQYTDGPETIPQSQHPDVPLRINLNHLDWVALCEALIDHRITSCDDFMFMPLTWDLHDQRGTATFSVLDLINFIADDLVDQSNMTVTRWTQLVSEHVRHLNIKEQMFKKQAADQEKQVRAEQQKETVRKQQQAIMDQFKAIQAQFDFSDMEDDSDDDGKSDTQDDTHKVSEPGSEMGDEVPVETPPERTKTLEERMCVVCQSNHSTKEDPLGMVARYQFSNHHGMPPLNRMSRAFQTSIFLRDLKKVVPAETNFTPTDTHLASLSVTASLVEHDDLDLQTYNESCLFERHLAHPDEPDKLQGSSFLDYLLPQKDYVQNCQSSALVWWSCGHFMHRSCCREHRRGSRGPQRGLNLGAAVLELLNAAENPSPLDASMAEYETLPTPSFGSMADSPATPAQAESAASPGTTSSFTSDSSAASDEEVYDRSLLLQKAGITPERFAERIEENINNPFFSKQSVVEPICPYCSRRFNCLLISPNHQVPPPPSPQIKIEDEDTVPFESCYTYIDRIHKTLQSSVVLPPIFHAVTYRQTLAKLLLANAQAIQKSPELIFNPEWIDLSEIGCVISAKYSLIAPSIPAHVCFDPPHAHGALFGTGPGSNKTQAFHVLQTHPNLTVADCIANILAVEEITMRRECRNTLAEIELEMVKRLHLLFIDARIRLQQTPVSDPHPLKTLLVTEDQAVALGRSLCEPNPETPLNGFDVVKYNVLSCLLYGRTCYSPVDGSDLGMPNEFSEANHAMIRSFGTNRSRWIWLTRAWLVLETEPEETRGKLLFDLCLLIFMMEYIDALNLFACGRSDHDTTHPFTAILLAAIKTNWAASPSFTMREPFGTLNDLFQKESSCANADLVRAETGSLAGSHTHTPRSIVLDCQPKEILKQRFWEDSPEAMTKAARFEVTAAKALAQRIRRRELQALERQRGRRASLFSPNTLDSPAFSDLPVQSKRRKTDASLLPDNFERWRHDMTDDDWNRSDSATSLPDMMCLHTHTQRRDTSVESLPDVHDLPHEPIPPVVVTRDTGADGTFSHLEGLLRNVRDLVERITSAVPPPMGMTQGATHTQLRPPLTERHECEHVGGPTFTHKRRRGSFKYLPQDTTMRYAKFLAEQRETDLCRMTPERRRRGKKLYIQMLLDPLNVVLDSKFDLRLEDLQIDTLTSIALFSCLPFLRFLKLLTLSLYHKKDTAAELLRKSHELYDLTTLRTSDKFPSITEAQLLTAVRLLAEDTPLQKFVEMFQPRERHNFERLQMHDFNDTHKRFFHNVFKETATHLNVHWYMRFPRRVSLLKDDGSLMKNSSTLVAPYMIVKNAQAESLAFNVELNCFHSTHLLHLLRKWSADPEIARFLYWYTNPLLTPYAPRTYKGYISSMVEKNSPESDAMSLFTSHLPLPITRGKQVDYAVHLRLWIPYFISLPTEYSLFFHTQLQRLMPRLAMLTSDRPVHLEDILHVPKNNLYICMYCGLPLCVEPCCLNKKHMKRTPAHLHNPLARHTASCTARIGVFLHPASTVVFLVVVRPTVSEITAWGSVYRDEFGEEDRFMMRGRPLHLSRQRVSQLFKECWSMTTFRLKTNYGWLPLR